MSQLNIALIGTKFMGRAHSNAWLKVPHFFTPAAEPVLKVACGRDRASLEAFARRWGWEEVETDWRRVVARDDIDVVDIAVPQTLHKEIAVAAAQHGKHVFCEKPAAMSRAETEAMLAAAEAAGVRHYLNHNYRRTPAVALAKKLIEEGRLGRVFHWRSAYYQDWLVDPEAPLRWQLRADKARAGAHWDLGSHTVDLARFLVGEIAAVSCLTTNFVAERPDPAGADPEGTGGRGAVTVDDASIMMAEFASGAVGSFEASRNATGRKNSNRFEIYGSGGSLAFDLERSNELEFFDRSDPAQAQGFRTILATAPDHPYVGNWWPPGHIIGYEHPFVHAAADFIDAVVSGAPITPNFEDAVKGMAVLEAGLESARTGRKVAVAANPSG